MKTRTAPWNVPRHSHRSGISSIETLDDSNPAWHPPPIFVQRDAPRSFIYREITAESYQRIDQYPELADEFDLEKTPGPSVLSWMWRERFDDAVRELVKTGEMDYAPVLTAGECVEIVVSASTPPD
ncbi:hypothetical protein A4G99_20605 [Haladaptatus sp. R4]|nr:hypothetical protein [Haladaptatus sp. R4]KZN26456.1 hypothetical protein A4G99_20605 [Haladaptatus sp. R4]